jgi:hypothetical protein
MNAIKDVEAKLNSEVCGKFEPPGTRAAIGYKASKRWLCDYGGDVR